MPSLRTALEEAIAANFASDGSLLPLNQVVAFLHSTHFPTLRHLHLHASDLGDEGCSEIVRSAILNRLETLDLSRGCISDVGARILCDCPDIKRLKLLAMKENELSAAVCGMVGALGIEVHCSDQHDAGSNEYLWSGDRE